jgi:Ser/Thr protein kinase RdoA (MazF antagonist)
MLPVDDIQRLGDTVDDQWRSPVADDVARRWGIAAGRARWLRSSSTHVFVVPAEAADVLPAYLRFAPLGSDAGRKLSVSAALMEAWARSGIRVVRPIVSVVGRLTEGVPTALGDMVAMLVPAAEGIELEVGELTEARAAEWGAALGRLHRDGFAEVVGMVPGDALLDATQKHALDPELTRAGDRIAGGLRELDPRMHSRGVCHGDFELDNLRFGSDGPTFFDADEAHHGWFAGDVAMAVRDLAGVTLDAEPKPLLLAAFLAGYRSERQFTIEEEQSLSLHSAAASLRLTLEIEQSIGSGDGDGEPQSLRPLREALGRHADWHRGRVLEWQG